MTETKEYVLKVTEQLAKSQDQYIQLQLLGQNSYPKSMPYPWNAAPYSIQISKNIKAKKQLNNVHSCPFVRGW